MPATTIEVRYQYSVAQEVDFIDAVHRALVSAFKIPEYDRDIRLLVHMNHIAFNAHRISFILKNLP